VVIKLSGAYFSGPHSSAWIIRPSTRIAGDLIAAKQIGVDIGVVVGGGKYACGRGSIVVGGLPSDLCSQLGMLATVMKCWR